MSEALINQNKPALFYVIAKNFVSKKKSGFQLRISTLPKTWSSYKEVHVQYEDVRD